MNQPLLTIRRAEERDIPGIMDLLVQVCMVHHRIRPDLFKGPTTKYDADELAALPFDVLRWIALKYSNLAHVKRVMSDQTFPADVIIDCCNRVSGLEEAFDRNRMIGIPEPENN